MNAPLTPHDWEFLSTYLDGALNPAEQRRAQEMLSRRPELGLALEELRRTRALLRMAPRRRAPRNFTLTPAMARQARPRFLFSPGWVPSLSFASALTALLLVLSFFVRLPAAGLPAAAVAPMMAQAPAVGQADRTMQEKSAAPAQAAGSPIILWNDTGRGAGAGPDNPAPAVAATPAKSLALESTTTTPADLAPAATAAPKALTALATDATATERNGLILGVAPTEQRGRMLTPVPAAEDLAPVPPPVSAEEPDRWPWVQAGLGLVALLSGATALLVWWRRR